MLLIRFYSSRVVADRKAETKSEFHSSPQTPEPPVGEVARTPRISIKIQIPPGEGEEEKKASRHDFHSPSRNSGPEIGIAADWQETASP